jgi:hypothetical protein
MFFVTGSSPKICGMASPPLAERSQVTICIYWVGRTGTGGYADNNNGIHPRCPSGHQLQASEISSVQSPIMSRNMAWAPWLLEKKLTTPVACFFSRNQAALAGYVVHNRKLSNTDF